MKRELIVQLHASFEQLIHVEQETGVEFWLARDLQETLGYQTWRSFEQVVQRAVTACQNSGYEPSDHFAEISKMIPLGSVGWHAQSLRWAWLGGVDGQTTDHALRKASERATRPALRGRLFLRGLTSLLDFAKNNTRLEALR